MAQKDLSTLGRSRLVNINIFHFHHSRNGSRRLDELAHDMYNMIIRKV